MARCSLRVLVVAAAGRTSSAPQFAPLVLLGERGRQVAGEAASPGSTPIRLLVVHPRQPSPLRFEKKFDSSPGCPEARLLFLNSFIRDSIQSIPHSRLEGRAGVQYEGQFKPLESGLDSAKTQLSASYQNVWHRAQLQGKIMNPGGPSSRIRLSGRITDCEPRWMPVPLTKSAQKLPVFHGNDFNRRSAVTIAL